MLEKGGGVLVDGNACDLARAIEKVLSDGSFRRSLALEGRSLVEENFTRDVMGRNHLSYYEKITGLT